MTSDDFCPFLTPPPPLIRCFVSEPYFIKSDLAEPPSPLASDVIYGRPLIEKKHPTKYTTGVSEQGRVDGQVIGEGGTSFQNH